MFGPIVFAGWNFPGHLRMQGRAVRAWLIQGRCHVTLLTVLVPAVGDQSRLDDTLVSVLENRPDATEVIVACPQGYVDPYALDDELRFLPSDGSVADLLNAGVAAAKGQLLHVLAPGWQATPEWTTLPCQRLLSDDGRLLGVSPLEDATSGNSWSLCGFFVTEALAALGGWNPRIVATWRDVEFSLRAHRHGWRLAHQPHAGVTQGEPIGSGHVSAVAVARDFARLRKTYPEATRTLTRSRLLRQCPGRVGRWMGAVQGAVAPLLHEPITVRRQAPPDAPLRRVA